MAPNKRQDKFEVELIVALLTCLHKKHAALFDTRALRNTTQVVRRRVASEGLSFLTKTLPKLGKAFDKAIAGETPLNATGLRFTAQDGSQLPIFMGELFNVVLDSTGVLLQDARADHVGSIREVMYLFYKYNLPYSTAQEQEVLAKFEKTEQDLLTLQPHFSQLTEELVGRHTFPIRREIGDQVNVIRKARLYLWKVLKKLDLTDINPTHGPGAVATKQRLWAKYEWTNISARLTQHFPLDSHFMASAGHVCDSYRDLSKITDLDLPARVILVPKDSRGPRLISCEPVEFQWIQQGIMRKLVDHIERHPLTRNSVRFTDQVPNQLGALLGSRDGQYSTLDLNEASDRVSVDLVRLLFPSHICEVLEAARTVGTVLPDGRIMPLQKFAPMGSAICFPVLALTIWAILAAVAPDRRARERTYVYGDDVVVPTAQADEAIKQLESFGLKVNRDKSCTKGFFRESCGMDAFKGVPVTPVKIKTVWSSAPSSETYTSWIAYANSMYDRRNFDVYDAIVERLIAVYRYIPDSSMSLTCPHLVEVPELARPKRFRINRHLQKKEWLVWDVKVKQINHEMSGWNMLLRYFTQKASRLPDEYSARSLLTDVSLCEREACSAFSVRVYTRRGAGMLALRWR